MDHDLFLLALICFAAVGADQFAERSGLLPHPKMVLRGVITVASLLALFVLVRRVV